MYFNWSAPLHNLHVMLHFRCAKLSRIQGAGEGGGRLGAGHTLEFQHFVKKVEQGEKKNKVSA